MPPLLPIDHRVDGFDANAVLGGKCRAAGPGFSSPSDGNDFFLVQDRPVVLGTGPRGIYPSPLDVHVFHVVRLSAREQMCWVAARWIVAFVQNVEAIKRAADRLEGYAMRLKLAFTAPRKFTIAHAVCTAEPRPALAGSAPVDSGPAGAGDRAILSSRSIVDDVRAATSAFVGGLSRCHNTNLPRARRNVKRPSFDQGLG